MITPVRSKNNPPEEQIRRVFPEAGGEVEDLDEGGPKYEVSVMR